MEEHRGENMTLRALYLLAILFVVDGHVPLPDLLDLGGVMKYYSFHLLLFAFGSGYFFRLHGGVGADIAHRARRLLLPLYAWNLAYGLLAALLRRFGGFTLGAPLSAQSLLLLPLTDGEHFAYNLGAWYLFPLFLSQVAYAMVRCAAGLWGDREGVSFALCLAVGCLAAELCHRELRVLPLWALRAMILLPGYAAGALYRRHLEAKDTLPNLPYFGLILALRAVLLLPGKNLAYLLSSGTYFEVGAFGVYAGAALAIAFWLRVARMIAPMVGKSRLLLAVSRHTLPVMMHHYMGFFAVDCFFLLLNKFGLGAASFSVHAFRTQQAYIYAPGGNAGYTLLYLAAGLALPLGVAWAQEALGRAVKAHMPHS